MNTPKQLNMYLDRSLYERLAEMATATDSSVSKFVRDAIRERLHRIETEGKVETAVVVGEMEKAA